MKLIESEVYNCIQEKNPPCAPKLSLGDRHIGESAPGGVEAEKVE